MPAKFRRSIHTVAAIAAIFVCAADARAQSTRVPLEVTGYTIDAQVDPTAQRLTATAAVTFTAKQDLTAATFELNNGLRITRITDSTGKTLDSDRDARRSTVTVALTTPIQTGTTSTFTFEYAGILKDADTSPVEGIKLAAIADPVSILLYPGGWFPIVGLYTDRFTMALHVTVPSGETAVASGFTATKPGKDGGTTEFDFDWAKSGFPGSLVVGKFAPEIKPAGMSPVSAYVTDKHKAAAPEYAALAGRDMELFTTSFGQLADGSRLTLVEIPDDSISASWAPGIAFIAGSRIGDRTSHRLLANTIARQWWGNEISPATLNDAWITNGMSRYAELMNLEDTTGKAGLEKVLPDIEAGALAYDTVPLTSLARVDYFSPQFQSMTLEKGAMVFHMLRYQMGEDKFLEFLRGLLSQYTDKPVTTSDLETAATAHTSANLTPFFAQWLDGTGAPTFHDKFTVYRLGGNKGFRTVGAVSQDLDLFRMPVDLRVETDGKTETRRIDVSGSDSTYTIETFGRPRKITIDPSNWVLKSTPDLAVRVAVLKGQQLVAQGDLVGALAEYQKALDENRNSSLANYRIAEIFYTQRNYQSAANSYRDALRGDGEPKWTVVWSHIGLGKIFDITGQRDRAVQEYRLAIQTNDNSSGAINEARALIQKPYVRPKQTD